MRVFCLPGILTLCAMSQSPSDLSGVQGSVVSALTGQPVRKARVILAPVKKGEPLTAVTDAQGKYTLPNVPPGIWRMGATRDGFLSQAYGAKKPGDDQRGEPLELTAGAVKKVDLQLTPLGSITGRITDENGDPVRQVQVAVMGFDHGPAGKTLQARTVVQTDAAGEYRIYDLPPGKYYLRAKPQSAQMPGMAQPGSSYATVFYPNALQASSATPIDLVAGQEQRGLNFSMRPIATSFIRGRVIKPAGSENCSVAVEGEGDGPDAVGAAMFGMISHDIMMLSNLASQMDSSNDVDDFAGVHSIDKEGKFEYLNIPIGSHTLAARCEVNKQRYSVKKPIELDAQGLPNVELRPVGPSAVTGKVRVEGESKSNLAETRIWLESASGENAAAGPPGVDATDGTIAENGEFAFHNVSPLHYRLHVEPAQGLYLKSATWSDRDVTEPGLDFSSGEVSIVLDVMLSANGGTIEGSIENGASGKVTLIPADPERVKTLAKSEDAEEGHFSFKAVPPGRYKLFAWEDADPNQAMYDAEFRKPYEAKGETVEVAENQKVTVQLKPIPAAGN
ncbi:MAG TPA: carboxypeptidase-like regulatory domain-containing protein [Bryobacteraceae bacterium]|nr:carboxypeptidase-like regulatory domain-containing protein [Bryobacteraceae bacterium]